MAAENENNGPFNREVENEENDNSFGEVIKLAPPSLRVLAFLMSFVAIFSSVFLWQVSYTKKEEAAGVLLIIDKPIKVLVPAQGTFAKITVKNGQDVKSGDLIAVINRDLTLAGGTKVATSQATELGMDRARLIKNLARLSEKRRLAEDRSNDALRGVDEEVAAAKKILDSYEKRGEFLERKNAKLQKLHKEKILSSFELESIKNELAVSRERILNEKRNIESIQSRVESINLEKISSLQRINDSKTQIESQLSALERQLSEKSAQVSIEVHAKADGKVTGLMNKDGDPALPGALFFTLVPNSKELEAELYIPAKTLPFVKENEPIFISIDAFPPQKYGLFPAKIRLTEALPMTEEERHLKNVEVPSYLVKLKLSDQTVHGLRDRFALEPGMRITAKVALSTRKLWDWVSEPLQKMWKMSAKKPGAKQ